LSQLLTVKNKEMSKTEHNHCSHRNQPSETGVFLERLPSKSRL
jgi:hypothetical protein